MNKDTFVQEISCNLLDMVRCVKKFDFLGFYDDFKSIADMVMDLNENGFFDPFPDLDEDLQEDYLSELHDEVYYANYCEVNNKYKLTFYYQSGKCEVSNGTLYFEGEHELNNAYDQLAALGGHKFLAKKWMLEGDTWKRII